jgi:hypothetical protein
VVVETVAANATVPHCDEMAMKGPDDCDQIAAILNLIRILCCTSFGFVGTIGNGFDGHDRPPVLRD